MVKFTARLVAGERTPVQDLDYDQVFTPTLTAPAFKTLPPVAVEEGLSLFHFDITQAFIQARLESTLYTRLPPECGASSGKTVKLEGTLYGLK